MTATKNPRTVIFLGAGASASEQRALTQRCLLKEYFDALGACANNSGDDFIESPPADCHELRVYFQDFWGIDVSAGDLGATQFPTFEEALGLLEIAAARGESFKGYGGLNAHTTRGHDIRLNLIMLIARILDYRLRVTEGYHERLVRNLQVSGDLPSTSFISLNYDILMDKAVRAVTGKTPRYGGPAFRHRGNTKRSTSRGRVLVLKMHGSLNWLYCPTCNQLSLYFDEKVAAHLGAFRPDLRCDVCDGSQEAVIIPPSFFKSMDKLYLQEIWRMAEKELLAADWIVFCGYSFPDADIHIKYLLKRAEMNRSGDAPQVFVVNQHPDKTHWEREAELSRYMRFFREKDRVHWTELSFAEFAADPRSIDNSCLWRK
jgi:hypothetical protein